MEHLDFLRTREDSLLYVIHNLDKVVKLDDATLAEFKADYKQYKVLTHQVIDADQKRIKHLESQNDLMFWSVLLIAYLITASSIIKELSTINSKRP